MAPVRRDTEYGYGKEIAGLSTGTDYSQQTKFEIKGQFNFKVLLEGFSRAP